MPDPAVDIPGPDPEPRPAGFRPPRGSVDTHFHVFGDPARYPYVPNRSYTPPAAPYAAYTHMLDALGIARGVLVQPSVYGTDNRLLSDILESDRSRLRGIAVIDRKTPYETLERLDRAGVRGVRANLLYRGGISFEEAALVARRVVDLGWHLQLLIDVSAFPDLRRRLEGIEVPLVFDHMGHMPAELGPGCRGFREMLALLREGRAWVKLSGAYRISRAHGPLHPDVDPLAAAILETAPGRAVWATDWPHPAVTKPMPNDGALLDLLQRWAPDESLRHRVLVDNPAELYGFGSA
jgi:predicted TIM-barrel fold metal-dependent hydrolase